jgi:hypothetical protein
MIESSVRRRVKNQEEIESSGEFYFSTPKTLRCIGDTRADPTDDTGDVWEGSGKLKRSLRARFPR